MTSASDPRPSEWPILVTGAGGFVGGHVARAFAAAGYPVRGLTRRAPGTLPGDPDIEWAIGDIRDPRVIDQAVRGVRGVVHSAGWVSLGSDRRHEARAINVDATQTLLASARRAGVERLVFTSTLWTMARGTADSPADEDTPWNLDCIGSPYCDTKREAERLVLGASCAEFRTTSLSPSLVIGVRDTRPTSTGLLLEMARTPLALLPAGGIPVIDARVLALAHIRALERAEPGRRYIVAGPYLSYAEMAALVAQVAGRPKRVLSIKDSVERPLARAAGWLAWATRGRLSNVSSAAVAGGFLRLHVSGARADAAFGLVHPHPIDSIFAALDDHKRSGRAPWLKLREPYSNAESSFALVNRKGDQ